eukprot:COSAG02_NODE_2607_length_8436_cov_3.451841_7_plen_165_part_00
MHSCRTGDLTHLIRAPIQARPELTAFLGLRVVSAREVYHVIWMLRPWKLGVCRIVLGEHAWCRRCPKQWRERSSLNTERSRARSSVGGRTSRCYNASLLKNCGHDIDAFSQRRGAPDAFASGAAYHQWYLRAVLEISHLLRMEKQRANKVRKWLESCRQKAQEY